MKCKNCGTKNLKGTERCKNCGYEFNQENQMNGDDTSKNAGLLVLFNIIYSFLIPIVFVLMSFRIKSDNHFGFLSILILFIASIIHFFGETISFIQVKAITKNTYNFKKITFYYDIFALLCYFLFAVFVNKELYWLMIILAIFKISSLVLANKFVLKEKFNVKKSYLVEFALYLLFLFLIPNLFMPTSTNEFLFKVFGRSEFSSKKAQILLVKDWNNLKLTNGEYVNRVTYFHKFTNNELKRVEIITTDGLLTNKDLSKFKYLTDLNIKNFNRKKFYDLSSNARLLNLKIENSEIQAIDSKTLGDVRTLTISSSNLKEININKNSFIKEAHIYSSFFNNFNVNNNSSLANIECDNLKINNVVLKNNSNLYFLAFSKSEINNVLIDNNPNLNNIQISKVNAITLKNMGTLKSFLNIFKVNHDYMNELTFKTLVFDNQKISFKDNQYIKFNGTLYFKKKALVKDLLLENLTAKVYDYYHDKISCDNKGACWYDEEQKIKEQGLDSVMGDNLKLYDNNNELILDCSILELD